MLYNLTRGFPRFLLFPCVFPCFSLILPVSPCFSMFSPVSPCFPVLSHVSPCFAMFFYVFPWFSGVLHEIVTNRLEKSTKSVPRTRRGFRLSPAFFTLNSRWPRRWDAQENRGVSPLDRWNQSFEGALQVIKMLYLYFLGVKASGGMWHPRELSRHAFHSRWLPSFFCLFTRQKESIRHGSVVRTAEEIFNRVLLQRGSCSIQ